MMLQLTVKSSQQYGSYTALQLNSCCS